MVTIVSVQAKNAGVEFRYESVENEHLLSAWKPSKHPKSVSEPDEQCSKIYHPGGLVQVSCREMESDGECARILFICRDTGIGMSEEYLPHIFEEFTRERTTTESHVTGTGLGLPIVKALVDLMGGTIECFE